MTIETEVRARLVADATVSGLIGTRAYALVLPQGVTYPALTYSKISGVRLHNLDGAAGRAFPRISISMWSGSYVECQSLAAAVRHSLDGFNGTLATIKCTILIDNEIDDYDGTVEKYRILQDYRVSHRET